MRRRSTWDSAQLPPPAIQLREEDIPSAFLKTAS